MFAIILRQSSMKKIFLFIFFISALAASPQNLNRLTVADKIYGLSKMWQEANYNFVYLNKIDKPEWDSFYKALIISVQKTTNDFAYYRELEKFYAFLKDGHTNIISYPGYIDSSLFNNMFGKYRLFVKNIDHKAIIVQTNASIKNEVPVGSEIIEVNGLPTKDYINKNVAPYISSSTKYVLEDEATSLMFLGLNGDKYSIKIKTPNNIIKSLVLTHEKTTEQELFPSSENNFSLLKFKWYKDGIAYCALNSFEDPKVDTLFTNLLPQLKKAKALIIDLRNNGGGNTNIGFEIIKYLTKDTLLYGSKSYSRMLISTYKAWGKFVEPKDTINNTDNLKYYQAYRSNSFYEFPYSADTIKNRGAIIVIPTVILMGHFTASAAEDFLIYADKQKHIIKIGENSNGSTGQPYYFNLPGGGAARVCTKKDTYPDGREFVGYGVKPDIVITPTVTDFINHNDPVIKKAIQYLKSKIE